MKSIVLYKTKQINNIREGIENAVEKYPAHNAFIIKNNKDGEITYKNITYKEMQENINCLGTALIHLGLKNKRIALISPNRYEWAISYLAVVNGVGVIVPLDKSLPHGELENLLERSSADAIIFSKEYEETILSIKKKSNSQVSQFISMDEAEDGDFLSLSKLIELGRKLVKEGHQEYINAEIDNEKMSIMLFTSGTTSAAKAVMLSHKNIASNINSMNSCIKIYDTDVNISFLPLHHTFGCTGLLLFLCNGVTNVFCDGLRYVQKNLQEYKVSVFVGVPLLLESMHKKIMKEIEKQGKQKKVKFGKFISGLLLKFGIDIRRKIFKDIINQLGGNIRMVVSGAAAIDKAVAMDFDSFGIRTIQGYGLTETSPVLVAENDKCKKYGSVGIPLKDIEIRIDNPNELGIGEIVAKGPNVMLGYYNNEEATKEVLVDGWFHTGDLGYVDKEGYLFITGRMKNVIVMKNGKNIYPEELETLIAKLPYVEENMVFGIPTKDDDLDLAVKIVYNKEYVKEAYPDKTLEELKDIIWTDIKKINKTMPPYKYIRELIVTDEPMIKTTTQKVKRFEEIKNILKN